MLNVVQRIAMLVVLLLMPAMVWGQEEEKGGNQERSMVPYFHRETTGFLRLATDNKDFAGFLDFVQGLKIAPEEDLLGLNVLPFEKQRREELEASGISDLYFWFALPATFSPSDTGRTAIVQLKKDKSGLPFTNTLKLNLGASKLLRDRGSVLIGSTNDLKYLRNGKAEDRNELMWLLRDDSQSVLIGGFDVSDRIRTEWERLLYDLLDGWSAELNLFHEIRHVSFSLKIEGGVLLESRFLFPEVEAAEAVIDLIEEKKSWFLESATFANEVKDFVTLLEFACEDQELVVTIRATKKEEVAKLQKCLAGYLRWGSLMQKRMQVEQRLSMISFGASITDNTFRRSQYREDDIRAIRNAPVPKADSELGLSWRVWILPMIGLEESMLFDKFHLDEPWDSEHNKKLIPKMPKSLTSPSFSKEATKAGKTGIVAVTDKPTLFLGKDNPNIVDLIIDKQKAHLLFVEVKEEHGVIWTKPEDVSIETKDLVSWLQLQHGMYWGIDEMFFVKSFPATLKEEELKSLLIRDDGKPMGAEK